MIAAHPTAEPEVFPLGDDDGSAGEASDSNPTFLPAEDAAERRAYEDFAKAHAAPEYRGWLRRLYSRWREHNAAHFDGRLHTPHLSIGRVSPRQFAECRLTTDYGGSSNLVLADRVLFGTDARLVRAPYPAEGLLLFADDLLLAGMVRQYVLEVRGSTEDGWGGYGPLFVAEASRIGEGLGLPGVIARRRGFRHAGQPVAASWPWAFRPDGYYRGHVRFDHLKVGGLRSRPAGGGAAVAGVYEYLLLLAVTGQSPRLIEVLGRVVDAGREDRSPAMAAAERRPLDASGMPLPVPVVEPDWLAWNMGCVRMMAEGVRTSRAFEVMPILADALQDAGCEDPVLLGHLRAHAAHTANCWALRLLTERSG